MNTLMGSGPIKVRTIPIEHALELLLVKDQQVVETFLSHTSQEAFANRIGSGSVKRRVKKLNRTRCRHPGETGPKFVIVIADQILRCLPKGRGFSELLGHPGISRGTSDSDMDHPSGLEFDEEEREERSKEEIRDLQEIAGPDIRRVIVQKGRPLLPSWLWCADGSHILLNGALADMKTEFQQFPTDTLSAPEPILHCHLPDQGDGFCRYLRLRRRSL